MSKKEVHLSKGDKVLVSLRTPNGAMTAQKGRVTELAGRGAFVFLDQGSRRFFHATDITIDSGDDSRPALAAPTRSEPLGPQPTIGQLFAAERTSRGVKQGLAARELGIRLVDLTDIEAGVDLPSDELVLKFSEVFGVDLGELSKALERSKLTVPPPAAPAPPPAPAPAEAAPPSAVEPPSPPVPSVERSPEEGVRDDVSPDHAHPMLSQPTKEARALSLWVANGKQGPPPNELASPERAQEMSYEDFVENLDALVSMPAQRERRQQWFAFAKGLFKLQAEGGAA